MRRTGPTNIQVQKLVEQLHTSTSLFWKRVGYDLQKPTRQRRVVNVYKIEKNTKDGDTIIVPGKVLSVGNLTKKVNVAAMQFSSDARAKIEQASGKVLSIEELLKQNPEGKGVKILG